MSKPLIKVCLVDDDEDDFILTKEILNEIQDEKYSIEWISTYNQALENLKKNRHDIYLVDFRLGEFTGIDLLQKARQMGASQPIIILTGKGNQHIDIEAMRSGAADYLIKDKIDSNSLERSIRYSLQQAHSVQALKESETKYRNIFEKTKDVIYITNNKGDFIDINNSAYALLGYTKEELMSINASELYADRNDRQRLEELINKQGFVKDFEVELLNKKHERLYCLLSVNKQPSSNEKEELYLGIIHDLTERKKAEQAMMNFEKSAATGRLARTIAHEVRNPLTNIQLAIEQLRGALNTNEETNMYMDIISRNSTRINQLITELLNSSKPTALNYTNVSVIDLLNETIEMAIDRILLKEIQVEKIYPQDCELYIDKEKMKIALLNIIINAVEAMPEKSGKLSISFRANKNKCIISIRDNGPGIAEEHLNKLFEPFFSNKPKGIGLGLTATQNIIFNHKGTIEVESEENKGTVFHITFNL